MSRWFADIACLFWILCCWLQLRCRLERMERRMSLVRQQGEVIEKPTPSPSVPSRHRERERVSHVRTSSPARTSSHSSPVAQPRGSKRWTLYRRACKGEGINLAVGTVDERQHYNVSYVTPSIISWARVGIFPSKTCFCHPKWDKPVFPVQNWEKTILQAWKSVWNVTQIKIEQDTGCPAVREKSGKLQTWEKSGNFVEGQGKNEYWEKSGNLHLVQSK